MAEDGYSFSESTRKIAVFIALTAAAVCLLLFTWYTLRVLLLAFAGILLAVLLDSGARLLQIPTKLPRRPAVIIVSLLFMGSLIGLGIWAGPALTDELSRLTQEIPDAVQNAKDYFRQFGWGNELLDRLPNQETLFHADGSQFAALFTTTFGVLGDIGFLLVAGIYLAYEPDLYRRGLVSLMPKQARPRAREVIDHLGDELRRWLAGQLFTMAVIGIAFGIGLAILGVPLALLLGVLAGLLAFVPVLGPLVTGALAILIAFSQGPMTAVWAGAIYLGIQTLEGWLLIPIVQKKAVETPPVLILMTQLIMALAAGVLGVALAVPLLVLAMVLIRMVYVEDVLGGGLESLEPTPTE